jgi:nucleotide sugar dehydrogenase
VVRVARPGQLIVLTSTSYVGTTDDLLVGPLIARGFQMGKDICVAFSPERIDPGNAVFSHEAVPRVVGGATPQCAQRAAELLRRTTHHVHLVSSTRAAELTKLYENTFRAVNIALVNEIADVSGELAVQITEVIDAAATKPYGFMPFSPGPGVGGHCIPCDPHYLLWQLRSKRVSMPLVQSAMNDIAERPARIVARVREELAERQVPLRDARILVVGVAYKPGVADVRESPALEIIERLLGLGADVSYTDPFVPQVWLAGSPLQAATADELRRRPAADLAILHTRHPGAPLDWLEGVPVVLDATYRAFDLPHRVAI